MYVKLRGVKKECHIKDSQATRILSLTCLIFLNLSGAAQVHKFLCASTWMRTGFPLGASESTRATRGDRIHSTTSINEGVQVEIRFPIFTGIHLSLTFLLRGWFWLGGRLPVSLSMTLQSLEGFISKQSLVCPSFPLGLGQF